MLKCQSVPTTSLFPPPHAVCYLHPCRTSDTNLLMAQLVSTSLLVYVEHQQTRVVTGGDSVEAMFPSHGRAPLWDQVLGMYPSSQQALREVEVFLLEEETQHRGLRSFANSHEY